MIERLLRQQRLRSGGQSSSGSFSSILNSRKMTSGRLSGRSSDGESSTRDAAQLPFIPLYSTVLPFAAYMASCGDLAKPLKELGLFNHFFVKWPPFELLQRAVLEARIVPLLPGLPSEAQSKPDGRRGSRLSISWHAKRSTNSPALPPAGTGTGDVGQVLYTSSV